MEIQVSNQAKANIRAIEEGRYLTAGADKLGMFAGAVKVAPSLLQEPYFRDASIGWKPFPTEKEQINLSQDAKTLIESLFGVFSLEAMSDPGADVKDLKAAWERVKDGHSLPIDYVKAGVALGNVATSFLPLPGEWKAGVRFFMTCGALFVCTTDIVELGKLS